MSPLKKISLALLVLLYVAAGINHFINPAFYSAIIPPYLPYPLALVYASGIIEIFLGLLLLPAQTRSLASILIAIMLLAFLPVHIYMLQQAINNDNYRVSESAAWFRLVLQPVLIAWVLMHQKK